MTLLIIWIFVIRLRQRLDSVRNKEFNICSRRPEKLAERVERFIKENNDDIKLQYSMFPDRPYDSKAVWGNGSKIERIMRS